jgi:hypothetical protein
MPLKTRGSSALEKAQRRLALLKSINAHLDLGHGFTIETYTQLIETTRATLEAHNTLVSNLDESRKTVTQMDKALSEFSERMLSGVATIYGRSSIEYAKAGGSRRKPGTPSTSIVGGRPAATPATQPTTNESTNGTSKTSAVS